MLVPRFALSQTAKEVVVTIKLPYVRVGDAELSVVRPCVGAACVGAGGQAAPHFLECSRHGRRILTDLRHRIKHTHTSQEGQDLAFYCKPYLLKLHFPHPLRGSEEDEGCHCHAVYDADQVRGVFLFYLCVYLLICFMNR
jgi:hypothetical protein